MSTRSRGSSRRPLGYGSLHAAPGNPGIARLGDCHPVRAEDGESLLGLARSLGIDLVVIGPEAPLVAGVADLLRRNGVAVFGPGRAAARIEGSKTFAKDVLAAAGVPTAETSPMPRPPCVVKVDGLAAGKGVFVCARPKRSTRGSGGRGFGGRSWSRSCSRARRCRSSRSPTGAAPALAPAQDYKRIGDGDTGPNTEAWAPTRRFRPRCGRGGGGRAGPRAGRRGAGAARRAVRRAALTRG